MVPNCKLPGACTRRSDWFLCGGRTGSVEYISKCYIGFQKCYSPKKYLRIILTRFNFASLANFRIWPPIQLYCIPSIVQICNTYLLLRASVICISPCGWIIIRITICFSFPRTVLVHTSCSGININSALFNGLHLSEFAGSIIWSP